jgi:UPF0271 protein
MSADELEAAVMYQVAALDGFVRAEGGRLRYVKAHGAMYNRAAVDPSVAGPIASAVARIDQGLRLVGPPGSALLAAGAEAGLPTIAEGFADRAYEPDGSLRSRRLDGAVHGDPGVAAAQAVGIARDGKVNASDGTELALAADTICLHGDTPGAVEIARAVRVALETAGIAILAPDA